MKMRVLGITLFLIAAAAGLWMVLGPVCPHADVDPSDLPDPLPTRVASLDPGMTELMVHLQVTDVLVARPAYVDRFPEIVHVPAIGTALTPNYEAIVRAQPDYILTSSTRGTTLANLEALAPVRVLPWLTLEEVVASTRWLGRLVDNTPAANALADQLQTTLSVDPPIQGPRVLLLLGAPSEAAPQLWFVKRNSLHGAALHAAGGRNAVDMDVQGPASMSIERLIEIDPTQIIILISTPSASAEDLAGHRAFWDRLKTLQAVKTDRIDFLVGGEHLETGPGILNLVSALARQIGDSP